VERTGRRLSAPPGRRRGEAARRSAWKDEEERRRRGEVDGEGAWWSGGDVVEPTGRSRGGARSREVGWLQTVETIRRGLPNGGEF
jgi:hypothetical protein